MKSREPRDAGRGTLSAPRREGAHAAGGARSDGAGLACLGATFAMGAFLGYRQIFSPDTGFHLSSARWIVEHHAIPRTDILTYTLAERPYVDLQWLYQLGLYAVNAAAGTSGIIVTGIALTLVFWGLLVLRVHRRDGGWPLSSCVLLLLFALATHWENRPQLLSWIYGSLVLLVLEMPRVERRRWLPALPVIFVLWVNSHSLFALGIVILAVFAADELRRGPSGDRRVLAWGGVALAACLLNPYGLRGLTFPLTQLAELQPGSPFKSRDYGIHEFLSPFDPRSFLYEGRVVWLRPAMFQLVVAALLVVAVIAGRRRMRLPEWTLLALFGYLFATAGKNFPYLVMACFPIAASGLEDAGRATARLVAKRLRAPHPDVAARRIRVTATAVTLLALFVPAATGALGDASWAPHRPGAGFDPLYLPVGSCRFLTERHVEGRVLNALGQGGYIHWITRQPVFVHGITEILGPRFYLTYMASRDAKGLDEALNRWQPTIAIVSVDHTPGWLHALAHRPDWRAVYRDAQETMFFHRSLRPDIAALPAPRAGADYPAFDDATAERIVREAVAKSPPSLWQRLRGVALYPSAELRASGCYVQTGSPDAAIGTALQGLDRTPYLVPELLLTLGHAYDLRGSYRLADVCFDAFLRAHPLSPLGRDIRRVRAERPSSTPAP